MERLPFNALRAFALVLERGGVRAAARELGISHSAISRHLRELESSLGVSLLERRDRGGLRPTIQGEQLAQTARHALHAMQQAVDSLREQRSSYSVSVSTTPSFASRWLLPRLAALERAYPRLEISVVVDQRLDEPGSFPSDIAIRTGKGPWPGLAGEALMDERLYPVMSPGLWRQSGRPTDPAQLRGMRLLHDRDPNTSWQLWRQQFGPAALDVRRGPRLASSDLVLRAAAQGLGVALARDRLTEDEIAAGTLLRPFGVRTVNLGVAYWIIRPRDSAPREAVRMFTSWLRQQAAPPGGGRRR